MWGKYGGSDNFPQIENRKMFKMKPKGKDDSKDEVQANLLQSSKGIKNIGGKIGKVVKMLTLCWTETAQVKNPSSSSIPSFAGGKPTVGGIWNFFEIGENVQWRKVIHVNVYSYLSIQRLFMDRHRIYVQVQVCILAFGAISSSLKIYTWNWQNEGALNDSLNQCSTYSAKRRDELGCTSPTTKRYPDDQEISQGWTTRKTSKLEGMYNLQLYNPFSHHQQGRIDFNTVNPSLSTGKDFMIHSL